MTSSPSTAQADAARKLAYVWARMLARYGALWANSHGEAPGKVDMGEWGELISPLTADQIRDGFTADMDRGSDFPPSSSRFRALCLRRTVSNDVPLNQRPGAAMYERIAPKSRRIESDTSRQAAGQEMQRMRDMLGIAS